MSPQSKNDINGFKYFHSSVNNALFQGKCQFGAKWLLKLLFSQLKFFSIFHHSLKSCLKIAEKNYQQEIKYFQVFTIVIFLSKRKIIYDRAAKTRRRHWTSSNRFWRKKILSPPSYANLKTLCWVIDANLIKLNGISANECLPEKSRCKGPFFGHRNFLASDFTTRKTIAKLISVSMDGLGRFFFRMTGNLLLWPYVRPLRLLLRHRLRLRPAAGLLLRERKRENVGKKRRRNETNMLLEKQNTARIRQLVRRADGRLADRTAPNAEPGLGWAPS